ncbi:MAG: AI-2E family transporter [Deltaproteobacteria bacterium]|nr:AI-2E family transporter [Deltaproteobacteria bacterium]
MSVNKPGDLAHPDGSHGSTNATSPPRSSLTIAGSVLIFIAVLLLIYFAYLTTRPVLLALVLAAAVASLASRLFAWMVRRLRGRRRVAALLSVLTLSVGVFVPFGLLGAVGVQRLVVEGTELVHDLARGGPLTVERLAPHLGPLGPSLQRAASELRPKLMATAPEIASAVGAYASAAGRAALRIGIGAFLFAVALYYFLLDGERWRERVVRLVPLPPAETRMFFERFHQVSVAVLVGNFGTALAQATAATLGYYVFGAPVPLLLGAATLFAGLVPLAGPALVWLPTALVVGVEHGWLRGGGLALYGLLVVSTVDNVVRPILTRRGLQLHPLAVFIGVFGGMLAFGFVGLFVGPLVVALMITVLNVYERHVGGELSVPHRPPDQVAAGHPAAEKRP